jgi:hypothetical protein
MIIEPWAVLAGMLPWDDRLTRTEDPGALGQRDLDKEYNWLSQANRTGPIPMESWNCLKDQISCATLLLLACPPRLSASSMCCEVSMLT